MRRLMRLGDGASLMNLETWRSLAMLAALALMTTAAPRALAATEYEWDPTWGLHEEEWYDPSDWFNKDDGKVDIEEVGNYGYDDTWYGSSLWNDYGYYDAYSYDYDDYQPTYTGYDSYEQWDPVENRWVEVNATEEASKKKQQEAKTKAKEKPSTRQFAKKDVVTMRGKVTNVTKVKTKGGDSEHTYAMLDVDKGKAVLVDFGPKAGMGKVKIEKGKDLQVRGPRAKFAGKYVLVAQQVSELKPGQNGKNAKKS